MPKDIDIVEDAGTPADGADAGQALPTRVLLEAIARRVCVSTTYNRMTIKIAPHILYTKHDELFVDAVTVERDGKKPKEAKVGTFKLSGLSGTELTRRLFVPHTAFNPADPKYEGTALLVVEA